MKLLYWKPVAGSHVHVTLLFGLGLVGGSVEHALLAFQDMQVDYFPYDWIDADLRARHMQAIETAIAGHVSQGVRQIDVVWVGGRSGFGSSEDDMAKEYQIVVELLALSRRLQNRFPEAVHVYHLLSSAGGLFEGCRNCTAKTEPSPLRPYGVGKMAQEALLHAQTDGILRRIYRPSSVYGYVPNGRVGLITALIENGRRLRPTHIFGRVDTLRDYVTAGDVGRFIADRILVQSCDTSEVFLLATGQAVSMHEVIRIVERKLGCALYLQFDPSPSNAQDITFMPSALPASWQPAPLSTGIAQLATKMYGG